MLYTGTHHGKLRQSPFEIVIAISPSKYNRGDQQYMRLALTLMLTPVVSAHLGLRTPFFTAAFKHSLEAASDKPPPGPSKASAINLGMTMECITAPVAGFASQYAHLGPLVV